VLYEKVLLSPMGGEINRHFAGARDAFRLIDPLTLDQLAAGSIPEHLSP
jgi:hypothetical protein